MISVLVPDGLSAPANVIRLVRQVGDNSGPETNGSSNESDEYGESETETEEEEEYTEDTVEDDDEEGVENEVNGNNFDLQDVIVTMVVS